MSQYLVPAESSDPRCEELKTALKLVSVYSHQINNQITVIVGNSELVHDLVPSHTLVRRRVDEIMHSARRIAAVTQKMLALKVPD